MPTLTRLMLAGLIMFVLGCETRTITGSEPVGDLTGTWTGDIWTYPGGTYPLSIYLYQRSNGDLDGDFTADRSLCVESGKAQGYVSGTSVSLQLKGSNGAFEGSGSVSVDSSGRPTAMDIWVDGTGWCNGKQVEIRVRLDKPGW